MHSQSQYFDTSRVMKAVHTPLVCIAIVICAACPSKAGKHVFAVRGDQVLLNGKPVKIIGLRCSNALMTDKTTQDLIERLLLYRMNGVNTVGVYFMGSRFGDIKGYRPDASLDPVYAARMGRLIEAADELGMIVLVGCLYWSESRAKEDLVGTWKQADANQAVANTVKWLSEHDYRNIFVDPDNEGMAHDATQWSIAAMIEAGHVVDPTIMIAYNDHAAPPEIADLFIHHSPKVAGKPWLDTEATPRSAPGGYWGTFSKATNRKTDGEYYNYSRIGRYTDQMKAEQIRRTERELRRYNGHMLPRLGYNAPPAKASVDHSPNRGGIPGLQMLMWTLTAYTLMRVLLGGWTL